MSWQSILRGVGVYSGCTRCVDVCPVGRDYDTHLREAQDTIAERTPEKERRLAEYEEPLLDQAVHEELVAWMDLRKASFPDSDV